MQVDASVPREAKRWKGLRATLIRYVTRIYWGVNTGSAWHTNSRLTKESHF